MKEQLIEFSTAKLAKEKGFDVKCGKWYVETLKHELDIPRSGLVKFPAHKPRVLHHEPKEDWHIIHCSAPTQSLLQKWLKEVHQLFVEVNIEMIVRGQEIFCVSIFSNDERKISDFGIIRMLKITSYKTYEEALEIGLQEALKLIK